MTTDGPLRSLLSVLLPLPRHHHSWYHPFLVFPHPYPHLNPETTTSAPTSTTTPEATTEAPVVYETHFITYPFLVAVKPKTTTTTTTTTTEAPAATTAACETQHLFLHHHHHHHHVDGKETQHATTTTTTTTTEKPQTTAKCSKHHVHHEDQDFVYFPNVLPPPLVLTSPMSQDVVGGDAPAPLTHYQPVTADPHSSSYDNPFLLADLNPYHR